MRTANEDALARIIARVQSGERDEAFERIIRDLDDITVIKLFRELDAADIADALRSCADPEAWTRVLRNMGEREAADLLDSAETITSSGSEASAEARERILSVLEIIKEQ